MLTPKEIKAIKHNEERAALTCLKSIYERRLMVINEQIKQIDSQ